MDLIWMDFAVQYWFAFCTDIIIVVVDAVGRLEKIPEISHHISRALRRRNQEKNGKNSEEEMMQKISRLIHGIKM